ncbi:unnamed protein product [Thelazia callipaeda]|uniref:FERM domain-containing protein n=1 Tax=Thelazia callipaeda TaxID=103827 RepID=A0A0N5CMQ6_THECL|nr:unnamed protein product [Thelazia callipaeda]
MNSDLNDQQLSPMQSTSEFGDSRKELRQVRCCVHGRPCVIASKLSRGQEEEISRDISSGSYNYSKSRYESVLGKSEPSSSDTISYGLQRKVERDSLDVPLSKWNLYTPCSSSSAIDLEPIFRSVESDQNRVQSSENERFIPRKVERYSLSGTVDAPFISRVPKKIKSREKGNQYELMIRPECSDIVLSQPIIPKEQFVRTAQRAGSVETSPSIEAYIGVMSERQAEEYVPKPTSFKLYHKMPKIHTFNDVIPSLGLYIIYRSGKGHIYNYPIKECKQYVDYPKARSKLTPLLNLQVEYGDPLAPRFFTLDALVSYYNIYVHLRQEDGECVADIFPVRSTQFSNSSSRRVIQTYQ